MSGNSFPTRSQAASTSLPSPGPLSWITLTTCLSTPSSEQKGGTLSLVLPSHAPCLVARNSHRPWAGCLLCPTEASVVSGEETRGTLEASHSSTATSTHLLKSSLWMGLGVFQGTSHNMSLSSSNSSTAHVRVSKLLCDDCTERMLVHSPLPGYRVLMGRCLPGYGAHLGRYPAGLSTQELCTEPPVPLLDRSDLETLRGGPEGTYSSFRIGL